MEEKLTICFLGNAYSIHTIKWVKFFADRGYNVHLISYDRPKEYLPPNINLYLIGKKLPFKLWRINTLFNLPLAFCQTKKIIKRIKPDIIHAHYITSYGHLALLTGFRPLVVTAWGSDILITPKESIIAGKIVKSVLKKTDLITCDADHMKEALIRFGADPFKIKIIYFGIDTKKFSPGDGDDELKKELGISGLKSVISLRSLEQIYNIETLIKAMPLVLREVSDARLIIAGIGSYEKKLKKMAKDMNLLKHIKFIGFVLNEDLPRYLRIADVYVSTSLSDGGIASSTAEAMACGLPVVITDFGENRKWVRNGENGFVIPFKSPEKLAQRIIYLLKNKSFGKVLGKKAREIIEERNNYHKEMEKMEDIYKSLIKNNKI